MSKSPQRIMIFGRPGSGKSTFALWLSKRLKLPLHHLDKYFFEANWVERDHDAFLKIQKSMVDQDQWIIDGNSIRSLEMRYSKADLVIYFNSPKLLCLFRILKRPFCKNKAIHDRAEGCAERITWALLFYLWKYEQKGVPEYIEAFRKKYPHTPFREIRNDGELRRLKKDL